MKKSYFFLTMLVGITAGLFFGLTIFADDQDRFVTIVNPVRISQYSKNPEKSFAAEYNVIKSYNLPATWLLTYDALSDKKVTSQISRMDAHQEFGIFLEVTPGFSQDAGVSYHDTGFWHHATSVFLSGYTQDERRRLIDKVFEKYKENFGEYPKSIGSWWTDIYSLNYIKDKYGVIANLVCSDQYSTDGYQIWGQPWQMPYYSSKNHPAIPASNPDNKLDVVNIQWASRDPLNGYESSLFSTQDYLVAGKSLDIGYFRKLVGFYLEDSKNEFSQITLGLEADLDPEAYKGEFVKQMAYVNGLRNSGIKVVTMSDFADWYRKKFPEVLPKFSIDSDDFLNTRKHSYWVITSNYRLFYIKDEDKNIIQIKDLRVYNSDISDPYSVSPNRSFKLSVNIPAVIDGFQNPGDIWEIPADAKIEADDLKILIIGRGINVPEGLHRNPLVEVNKDSSGIDITFSKNIISKDGVEIKDYSSEAIHFFKQKKAIFYLLTGKGWNYLKKVVYTIPQGEIYGLYYLKSLSKGSVMVYQGECLQCEYHTDLKPPAFSGLKNYVKKYSGKQIVYNHSVFDAKTRSDAKQELVKTGAKYIYLVKFENYIENLPFSPGDLGVENIFSNANAEIWRVK